MYLFIQELSAFCPQKRFAKVFKRFIFSQFTKRLICENLDKNLTKNINQINAQTRSPLYTVKWNYLGIFELYVLFLPFAFFHFVQQEQAFTSWINEETGVVVSRNCKIRQVKSTTTPAALLDAPHAAFLARITESRDI